MRIANSDTNSQARLSFDIENDLLVVSLFHTGYTFFVLKQKIDTSNIKSYDFQKENPRIIIRIQSAKGFDVVRHNKDMSRDMVYLEFSNGKINRGSGLGHKLHVDQTYIDLVLDVFERIYNLESFQKYIKTKPRPAQRNIDRVIKLDDIDFEDIASLQDFDYFHVEEVSIGSGIAQKDQDAINQYSLLHKDIQVIKLVIDEILGSYTIVFFVDNDKLESFNNAITAIQQKQMVKRLTK